MLKKPHEPIGEVKNNLNNKPLFISKIYIYFKINNLNL